MKLVDRLKKIEAFQEYKTPYPVFTTFGKMEIFGNQVTFGKDNDFVNMEDLKLAIAHLVYELGGEVKWNAKRGSKTGSAERGSKTGSAERDAKDV